MDHLSYTQINHLTSDGVYTYSFFSYMGTDGVYTVKAWGYYNRKGSAVSAPPRTMCQSPSRTKKAEAEVLIILVKVSENWNHPE